MVHEESQQPYLTGRATLTPADGPLPLEGLPLVEEAGDLSRPADRAYHGIRRAILTGQLKSGEHLREEPLAQMTGTSRTPVRDALGRLVAEGLARQENRHRFVADFSFEEVTIVFELRARIESYAASLAAEFITPAELQTLADFIKRIDDLTDLDAHTAAERFLKLNSGFHAVIVHATRSRQLQALVAQAVAVPLSTIKQFVWDQNLNIVRSNAQHRDILEALSNRNKEWAANAMAGHILSTKPIRPPAGDARRRG